MEVNIPIFKESKKSPITPDAPESNPEINQGAYIFNKDTTLWSVADGNGNLMVMNCMYIEENK